MIPTKLVTPRALILALGMAAIGLMVGGCDRVAGALDLTGGVSAISPHLVGEERLRVVIPATGAQATLGPVSRNGDVTVWQTLDGITLSFRKGVLVASRGLGDDLMSADVAGDLAMLEGRTGDTYYPHIRSYLTGEDQTEFYSFQCRRAPQTADRLQRAQTPRTVRKIQVECTSPRYDFTNTYWLSTSGIVLKSQQWISPTLQYMETESVVR